MGHSGGALAAGRAATPNPLSHRRNLRNNARAHPHRALDTEPAAECLDPIGQASETRAARDVGAADPVVGDLDANGTVAH